MTVDKRFYLTKEGMEKVKREYEDLKKDRHVKVSGRDQAPEVLHSEELNPDYLYFLEDLKIMEGRINELEYVLKNSEIIGPSNRKKGVIDVGATVFVNSGKKENQFTIVETLEANPDLGFISKESPVGRALLGGKEGDKVVICSPDKMTYEVKKIRYHFS